MCCGCGRDQSKPESPRKRPRILTGSAAVTARMLWPAQAYAACVHVPKRPSGLCDAAARGSGIASPKEMLHRRHHGRGFSRRADGSRQSRRRERTLVLPPEAFSSRSPAPYILNIAVLKRPNDRMRGCGPDDRMGGGCGVWYVPRPFTRMHITLHFTSLPRPPSVAPWADTETEV